MLIYKIKKMHKNDIQMIKFELKVMKIKKMKFILNLITLMLNEY